MSSLFGWVEATPIAITVRDSLLLTGALSAVHLLGFTLVTGGALVANLGMLGVLFPEHPIIDITRPTSRGILVGLAVSILTGSLLFAPRATAASINSTFQLKMMLLAAATVFHFTLHRPVARQASGASWRTRVIGAVGLSLWVGVAVAGCAYILFE